MLDFKAFDSFNSSLSMSGRALFERDRQAQIRMASELVAFYQGNHRGYLFNHIDGSFRDPNVRALYKRLAHSENIVALIADRVYILGRRKIEVSFSTADGKPHEAANATWQKIADDEIPLGGFDAFMRTVGVYVEVCKNVVAFPFWDEEQERIRLRYFTPNTLDVAVLPDNDDPTNPDGFRILQSERDERFQTWDYSGTEATGTVDAEGKPTRKRTGVVYESRGVSENRPAGESTVIELEDPATGAPFVPFVPFRSSLPDFSYYVEDGQELLLMGQETVARSWTQLHALMHAGAFKVPVLSGGDWITRENPRPVISLDPSNAIVEPKSRDGKTENKIRWDGPANEGMIKAHLEVIAATVEGMVASNHIAPDSVAASASLGSGVRLYIGSAALKEKQEASAVLHRASAKELVRKIVLLWNEYAVPAGKGEAIPEDAVLSVRIPPAPIALAPKDELNLDAAKLAMKVVDPKDLVRKYNPDASPERVDEILKAQNALDQGAGPTPPGGVAAGTLSRSLFRPFAQGSKGTSKPGA